MKSVLISIQPKWCELIASGKKTVEVRKTRPKIETPFKVYIYCTNNKRQWLRKLVTSSREIFITENRDVLGRTEKVKSLIGEEATFWENGGYNGKVIGEFMCDTYIVDKTFGYDPLMYAAACMSESDVAWYCTNKEMYGWHISNLVIYDKPKALSEFFHACNQPNGTDCSVCVDRRKNKCKAITRPPQSWCYVEERNESE